jgi:hypothetical protein
MARYAAYVSTQLGLRISRRLFARLVEDFAYDELSVDEIFAASGSMFPARLIVA